MNYYAVANGRNPGVYTNWKECQKEIIGFPGAKYKKFDSYNDALEFSKNPSIQYDKSKEELFDNYAYVDGSYNSNKKIVGYGGFIITKNDNNVNKEIIQGNTKDKEIIKLRNVAGEVLGARAIMEYCIEHDIKEIAIFYDYQGIESWALGSWRALKPFTKEYYDYYKSIKNKLHVIFVKVKGHTGIDGNEEVDKLAKSACGIMMK